MAIPVARVHLAMAQAALPALLPTPPKLKMMMPPLLPTPPCAVVIPMSSPPRKPSRADADQNWVASKSATKCSSNPGRASSCERWDSNKKSAAASSSSSSSSGSSSASRASSSEKWDSNNNKRRPVVTASRASSVERWDAHKKQKPRQPPQQQAADGVDDDGQSSMVATTTWISGLSDAEGDAVRVPAMHTYAALPALLPTPPCVVILPMSSPPKPSRADAVGRWDAHKTVVRPAASSASSLSGSSKRTTRRASSCEERRVSRASSAERWDAHKKPRTPQQQQAADGIDYDDGQSSTGSNDDMGFFAGPGFIASPEASMLPVPTSLMVRVAAPTRSWVTYALGYSIAKWTGRWSPDACTRLQGDVLLVGPRTHSGDSARALAS
nr:unnamed protein product [Digitaria exilis]